MSLTLNNHSEALNDSEVTRDTIYATSDGRMPQNKVKTTQAIQAYAVAEERDGWTAAVIEAKLNFEFQFSSKRVQIGE